MPSSVQALKMSMERLEITKAAPYAKKSESELAPRTQPHHTQKGVERLRRNEIIVYHVQSWMEPGSVPAPHDILRLFDCIERLVHLMEYSFSKILWQMLIYAEKYVKLTKAVKSTELFPLLVVAVTEALKMWEDYGPDLELTAHVCGISKKEISKLERNFLEKLDFNLCLSLADVEAFLVVVPILSTDGRA